MSPSTLGFEYHYPYHASGPDQEGAFATLLTNAILEADPIVEDVHVYLGQGGGHIDVVPSLSPATRDVVESMLLVFAGQGTKFESTT